jgi:signal transduction histidine kinase
VAVKRSRRDWIADSVMFVVAILIGLVAADSVKLPHGDAGDWIWVVGLLFTLALWARRRALVPVAIVLAVAATLFPTASGAAVIALFLVAVLEPARTTYALAAATVAGTLIGTLLYPDEDSSYLSSVAFGLAAVAIVVGWGLWVRARRELLASLTERAQRAEAEQQLRVEAAGLAERERIAREMHDVLAHRLSLLSLHAGALEFRPDASREDIEQAAAVIRSNAHQALEELRTVIGALRDDEEGATPAPPQPTLADVPELVQESRAAGADVRETYGVADLTAVPPSVGRHAYRIVQEGLTNARKHAPRCAVRLTVDGEPGAQLRVELRNPFPVGEAPTTIPGAAAGLVGLRERVALAGGALTHGRSPDGDYRLVAELPWPR